MACLNRTSVGLKHFIMDGLWLIFTKPQSNQRGIETAAIRPPPRPPPGGLNRTSVGLKLFRSMIFNSTGTRPQSNQRGIETLGHGWPQRVGSQPQSNQRGIET